jgi:hypothetical protein
MLPKLDFVQFVAVLVLTGPKLWPENVLRPLSYQHEMYSSRVSNVATVLRLYDPLCNVSNESGYTKLVQARYVSVFWMT